MPKGRGKNEMDPMIVECLETAERRIPSTAHQSF